MSDNKDKKQDRGFGKGKDGKKKDQKKTFGEEVWQPVTKLGRLVTSGKITSLEQIFRFSIPIKEPEIVTYFLKDILKEEVMQVKPVQKQTTAGQRTRFKVYVVVGDGKGHIGLGGKVHKEVQGAIKGAILDAKMNLVPVRRGYWGNKIGAPHTIPMKVTGKGGSVRIRLIPAPRGTGVVGAPMPKKMMQMAGINDVYTASQGSTKTRGNTLKACYAALTHTYKFLSPDMWGKNVHCEVPFDEHSKWLSVPQTK